ncbi:hypothetical protein [Clostridium sp. UBA6640]|uniref:hypothetical protein n=1 Tax=Clostridium sp. UBA6640 TaxID=1946370 RepID=UPI0025C73F6E|nr:hypothetical protein [Clostridium sp. UBA6640]
MSEVLVQVLIIITVILGITGMVLMFKKNNIEPKEKIFENSYTILKSLQTLGFADEETKNILRLIMNRVKYVEKNFKDSPNNVKENQAFNFIKEQLDILKFDNVLSDDDIRTFIRLAAAFLNPDELYEYGGVIKIEYNIEEYENDE